MQAGPEASQARHGPAAQLGLAENQAGSCRISTWKGTRFKYQFKQRRQQIQHVKSNEQVGFYLSKSGRGFQTFW